MRQSMNKLSITDSLKHNIYIYIYIYIYTYIQETKKCVSICKKSIINYLNKIAKGNIPVTNLNSGTQLSLSYQISVIWEMLILCSTIII